MTEFLEPTKSEEGFAGLPPTPKISEKYVFNKSAKSQLPAVPNPKAWFEAIPPRTKKKPKPKEGPPRMHLIV